jgi:hypothetical protein
MTVPVSDMRGAFSAPVFWLLTMETKVEAQSASTACTPMYSPGTLNVSNMISAVSSRFSGVFIGGSVCV